MFSATLLGVKNKIKTLVNHLIAHSSNQVTNRGINDKTVSIGLVNICPTVNFFTVSNGQRLSFDTAFSTGAVFPPPIFQSKSSEGSRIPSQSIHPFPAL